MIYFDLFVRFFCIGLFSYGGGYATLPFLYNIAETTNWYSVQQLTDMVAISAITPGPVGINVATFAGFITNGITGACIATFAVILPSYIIILILVKLLDKYKNNPDIRATIYALKPAGCGLLAAVCVNLISSSISIVAMVFLLILFLISIKKKLDPLFYLGTSALFGLAAGLFHLIH